MKTVGLMKKKIFTFLIDFMKSFLKFKMGQNGVFFNYYLAILLTYLYRTVTYMLLMIK